MPILTSLLFLIMLINCDDDAGSSPLTSFDGEWIIEQATLDSETQQDWTSTRVKIVVQNDTLLEMTCMGQPVNRKAILPAHSTLSLLTRMDDNTFKFTRHDGIDFFAVRRDTKLEVYLQPPRAWSYEEECPQDDSLFICSEGGVWNFTFEKK